MLVGLAALAMTFAGHPLAATATDPARLSAPQYPDTRADPIVETHFGERVADPYRWLENDVRSDKEVASWVERESALTRDYLARLPGRDLFAAQIDQSSA